MKLSLIILCTILLTGCGVNARKHVDTGIITQIESKTEYKLKVQGKDRIYYVNTNCVWKVGDKVEVYDGSGDSWDITTESQESK